MVNILSKSLCESCFAETDTEPCPECGYQRSTYEHDRSVLPIGSVLEGRYMIGRVLGKGGFGITYLAYDMKLDCKVAVKEYYPLGAAVRDVEGITVSAHSDAVKENFQSGAEKFYKEARLVAGLSSNPNIVNVSDVFRENETVYFTMGYLEGMTLKSYVEKYGTISEEQAVYIAGEVSNALVSAHDINVLHRDISPDNIMVCSDGTVKLLDFGAARQVFAEGSSSLSVILKQGYAPPEQYQKKGKQGPWTDIYSMGATLYYALTRKLLDDPITRLNGDDEFESNQHKITPALWEIIKKATMLQISERYQSIYELLDALDDCGVSPEPLKRTGKRSGRERFGSVNRRVLDQGRSGTAAPAMEKTTALDDNANADMNATVALNDNMDMNATVALEPDTNYTRPLDDAPGMGVTVALNNAAPVSDSENNSGSRRKKIIFAAVGAIALIAVITVIGISNISRTEDDIIAAETTITASVTEVTETEATSAVTESETSKTEQTQNTEPPKPKKESAQSEKSEPSKPDREKPSQTEQSSKPEESKPKKPAETESTKPKETQPPQTSGTQPPKQTEAQHANQTGAQNLTPAGTLSDGTEFYYSKPYSYRIFEGEAILIDYDGSDKNLTIPAKIDGMTVGAIDAETFYGCTNLESVSIPDGVTELGYGVFGQCTNLEKVNIPAGVYSIGDEAFDGCASLASITIPAGVTEIRYAVFNECTGLKSVSLANGTTSIGGYAFYNCKNLKSITIPDSVTEIDEYAFAFSGIKNAVIPKGVSDIKTYTFLECSNLESVTIPKGVTRISFGAFYRCSSLKSVTIPDSVFEMDDDVFCDCESLESVTISNNLTKIPMMTFANCRLLKSITIPDSVTEIESWAFYYCRNLETVSVPADCKVASDAFIGCDVQVKTRK